MSGEIGTVTLGNPILTSAFALSQKVHNAKNNGKKIEIVFFMYTPLFFYCSTQLDKPFK